MTAKRYRVLRLNGTGPTSPEGIETELNAKASEGYRLVQTFVMTDSDTGPLYRHTVYLVFEYREELIISDPWMRKTETAGDAILLQELQSAMEPVGVVGDPLLDGGLKR